LNRTAVPIRRVIPLDLNGGDQIHALNGLPQAIPNDRDLVSFGGGVEPRVRDRG
jgi:hypothetical protein